MRRFFSLAACMTVVACSSTKVVPNRFVVEKKWVRNTIEQEYLFARRIHRFTPIPFGKLIITGNAVDGLTAYDRESARLRWRLSVRDGVEAGAQLVEEVLYFGGGDGQFYAVQAESGKVLWSYPLKAEGIAKPLVFAGVVYVLSGNNVAHALNAKTGRLIWNYNRREASNISVRGGAQPALSGDVVYLGFSDGALVALNRSSGAVIWEANINRNKRFRDVDATPILDGDRIYVSSYDGSLYCLNKSDGKINWTVDEGGYEEVLMVGNILYYSSSTGKTMALDKGSGKILWTQTNPRSIGSAPTIYKGVLMIGEMDGALRFLDARTGDFLNEFQPGRGVTSRPVVDADTGEVFFMSADANLFALQVNWKRFAKDWPWD